MNKHLIEEKANDVRSILFHSHIPINLTNLCDTLNIAISRYPIHSEAYLICESGKTEIILRPGMSIERERFSIAHELGHFFLPGHNELMFGCSESDMGYNEKKPFEMEANIFASELLVPTNSIKTAIKGEIDFNLISEQANRYMVSLQTMALKMTFLTDECLAIVWVQDGVIRWAARSTSFEFFISKGKISKLSKLSNTYEFYKGNGHVIRSKLVDAQAWIIDPCMDTVYEDCIFFARSNSALILLRVPAV